MNIFYNIIFRDERWNIMMRRCFLGCWSWSVGGVVTFVGGADGVVTCVGGVGSIVNCGGGVGGVVTCGVACGKRDERRRFFLAFSRSPGSTNLELPFTD
jgi:hypothetical protein